MFCRQTPETGESLISRYDAPHFSTRVPMEENLEPLFEKVVIADVDPSASSNTLRAAAVRHIKKRGGSYSKITHDPEPVKEFYNPELFPMMYPTLFPYGVGGMEDRSWRRPLSLKSHVKRLFNLNNTRFQTHNSFLFSVFNMLQRCSMLLHTSLKVKKSSFLSVARQFAHVSPSALHAVSERISKGDYATAYDDQE